MHKYLSRVMLALKLGRLLIVEIPIAIFLIFGTLSFVVPISPASAEYDCGTYGAENYSSDCTVISTQRSSNSASPSPTVSGAGTTPTTVSPSQAPDTSATTSIAQQTNKSFDSKSFDWWPWVEVIIFVLLLVAVIIIAINIKRRHAQ